MKTCRVAPTIALAAALTSHALVRDNVPPVTRLNIELYSRARADASVAPPAASPRVVFGLPRPNPTRGVAEVPVTLGVAAEFRAQVFDARGRLVRELPRGILPAGGQVVRWDGRTASGAGAASGVYWLRVQTGSEATNVRLVIAR